MIPKLWDSSALRRVFLGAEFLFRLINILHDAGIGNG